MACLSLEQLQYTAFLVKLIPPLFRVQFKDKYSISYQCYVITVLLPPCLTFMELVNL